ncbi:MAG: sugar phosphate isomerase/epimerase [Armatimonadetes bacterium]|nr:sugar phosphate isomerase/epimerase [Armatimonadota bacterium]
MKLGLVTYDIARDWDLETLLGRCEALGYEAVELRTTHGHGVELALDADQRAAVRERFGRSPVKLWGLGTTCEYHSPDPTELQRNIEETLAWLDLARDLGAVGVKVRPNALPDEVPAEKTIQQIGEALAHLGRAAEERGVELWLEVHGDRSADPRCIAGILSYVDSPAVGACWNCNYPTDLIEGQLAPGFELLKERILSVHLHDFHEPYPYRELFERLAGIGYDRYCLAEIAHSSDPERVLQYFRVCFLALTGQAK